MTDGLGINPACSGHAMDAADKWCRDTGNSHVFNAHTADIYSMICAAIGERPELSVLYKEPKLKRAADDCLEDIGIRAAWRVIHSVKG